MPTQGALKLFRFIKDKEAFRPLCPVTPNLFLVRVERIELSPHPWQGRVLPLNDTRGLITITENALKSKSSL